ncbi:antibiotic biosynthesis monooxygenase, partial [Actinomadura sp. NPDC048032]|uniref:antibiotic biosynthesis monooxygenase family protein n=1 Tax=Actinomadura sp. NPDC048032 TaxID=3155747 RepID=UPI0033EE74C0
MIAITRYRVPDEESGGFAESMTAVLEALAASTGFRSGRLARTVDDPGLWALVTEWEGAGRRGPAGSPRAGGDPGRRRPRPPPAGGTRAA